MSVETRIRRVNKEELGAVLDSLGEAVKQVLAATSNSDNKEYTILYEYTLPTMTFTEPEDGDDLLGASLTDLQTDVTIGDDSITATLPYMEGYTGFSGDTKLQEGHFFAFKATNSAEQVWVTFIETDESGNLVEKKVKIYDENATDPYDGVMIKRIKNDDMKKIILTYKDLTNNEETVKEYECNFAYEPKEEDTSDDTPTDTPSDDTEGGSDDTTPDSEGGSDNTEGGAE